MELRKLALAIVLAAGSAALPAYAATSYTATVSGATATHGEPENATAIFSFNNTFTALSLKLTNTAGSTQMGAIASVLDGISFSLGGGVSSSALSLTSLVNPNGTITCPTKNGDCTFNATPVSLATSGWTFNSDKNLLAAGNGSFKPYGIANGNIQATDGIPNDQHNPYLNGPVTFEFTITNPGHTALSLTSASLYFGTKPDIQQALITSVPEPEAYAMLLAGLGLLGTMAHRRRNRHT